MGHVCSQICDSVSQGRRGVPLLEGSREEIQLQDEAAHESLGASSSSLAVPPGRRGPRPSFTDLVPKAWKGRQCTIRDLVNRAITLEQLKKLDEFKGTVLTKHKRENATGFLIKEQNTSFQEVVTLVVRPILKDLGCSWVEVVARREQPAHVFVCYTPQLPFKDAVCSLDAHGKKRCGGGGGSVNYWIREFAERSGDANSFGNGTEWLHQVLASPLCRGGVLLMDVSSNATPSACAFRSKWCVFELDHVLQESRRRDFFFDLAAYVPLGALKFGDPQAENFNFAVRVPKDLQEVWKRVDPEAMKCSPDAYQDVQACAILQLCSKDKHTWERPDDARASAPSWLLREGIACSWEAAEDDSESERGPFPGIVETQALGEHMEARFAGAYIATICGGVPVMCEKDRDPLEQLVKKYPEAADEPMAFGETAAFRACAWGNEDALRVLLAAKASVTKPRSDGVTPMQVAVAYKHEGIVTMLQGVGLRPEVGKANARKLLALQEDIPWSPAINWNEQDGEDKSKLRWGAFLDRIRRGPLPDRQDEPSTNGITIKQLSKFSELVKVVCEKSYLVDKFDRKQRRIVGNIGAGTELTIPANLYHLCEFLIKPLTRRYRCSYVHFITTNHPEQTPRFFVSHWWGGAFQETVRKLTFHELCREILGEAYWMCTLANNQHAFHLSPRLKETPFAVVLQSPECRGTVALVTTEATMFNRIWCVYEFYLSIEQSKERSFIYDLATFDQCAVLQLDGMGQKSEHPWYSFPLKVTSTGTRIQLEKAESTLEKDKNSILKEICGDREDDEEAYEKLNGQLRAQFASVELVTLVQGPELSDEQRDELLRMVREFPQCLDYQDVNGESGLFHAASFRCEEAFTILVEAGANLLLANKRGEIPVLLAFQNEMTCLKATQIEAVQKLETLELVESDKVGEVFLKMLLHATKLKKLSLVGCKWNMALDMCQHLGLRLVAMETLNEVTLGPVKLEGSEQVFPQAGTWRKLKTLNLAGLRISKKLAMIACPLLAAMADLEILDLSQNPEVEPHLPSILENKAEMKHLNLAECSVSAQVARKLGPSLAAMAHLETLTVLSNTEIGAGLAAMLENKRKLKTLNVAWCDLSKKVAKDLAPHFAVMDALEALDLYLNYKAFQTGPYLPIMLQNQRKMKKLNLARCWLSAEVAKDLAPCLAVMDALEDLNLAGNNETGPYLPIILQNKRRMKTLNLDACQLSAAVAKDLAPCLAVMDALEDLNLNGNDKIGAGLTAMLQNKRKMKTLDLASCFLSAEVSKDLTPCLAVMDALEDLDLGGNKKIGAGLTAMLQNKRKMKKLNLGSCWLSAEVAKDLAPCLAVMDALEDLDLSHNNKIGAGLTAMLQNTRRMKKLNLASCGLSSEEVAKDLTPCLAAMDALEDLDLFNNGQEGQILKSKVLEVRPQCKVRDR